MCSHRIPILLVVAIAACNSSTPPATSSVAATATSTRAAMAPVATTSSATLAATSSGTIATTTSTTLATTTSTTLATISAGPLATTSSAIIADAGSSEDEEAKPGPRDLDGWLDGSVIQVPEKLDPKKPLVGAIRDDSGGSCSCTFLGTKGSMKGRTVLLDNAGTHERIYVNLRGADVLLDRDSGDGDHDVYSKGDIRLETTRKKLGSACPGDSACESEKFTLKLKASQGGETVTIDASGACGC